ncbi:hypothetical protein N7490_003676 [Penicillium lividum]|nr:hypothetical protein N7490_003676 [Penicillium lividum]
MLLPSAIPCDVRRSSRFTPSRLFSTPPPSDRPSGNGLLGTCRALQSMLNGSPAPSPRRSKPRLQSPLPINAPRRSPRTRNKVARPASPRQTPPPVTLASTPPPPPSAPARGANKRRRSCDDDSDADMGMSHGRNRLSTPKRRRHAPYDLPLGLSSTDFYSLHSPPVTQSPPSPQRLIDARIQESAPINPDAPLPSIESDSIPVSSDVWTAEEDQHLMDLVLEKFRLSQQDWDDCARRMGRRNSTDLGQRWSSLIGEGRIGLRPARR